MNYPLIKYFKLLQEVQKEEVIRSPLDVKYENLYRKVAIEIQKEFPNEPIVLELLRNSNDTSVYYRLKTSTGYPSNELNGKFTRSIYTSFGLGEVCIPND